MELMRRGANMQCWIRNTMWAMRFAARLEHNKKQTYLQADGDGDGDDDDDNGGGDVQSGGPLYCVCKAVSR